ncbi:MAG: M56 family metallopeptidase [Singulisphaera sp.]
MTHELAHWKRRDHLAEPARRAACCLLPWNPLAWWARARLGGLSELACDDWVIASGQSATDYAESLLGLVPQRRTAFALAAVSGGSAWPIACAHPRPPPPRSHPRPDLDGPRRGRDGPGRRDDRAGPGPGGPGQDGTKPAIQGTKDTSPPEPPRTRTVGGWSSASTECPRPAPRSTGWATAAVNGVG